MVGKPTKDEEELLVRLTPSRKAVRAGDVFVMHLKDVGYVRGWVVTNRARVDTLDDPEWNLVYVYRHVYQSVPACDVDEPGNILIAPKIINRLGWGRGYLMTIGNVAPTPDKCLPVHCFEVPEGIPTWHECGRWVNEFAEGLPRRYEPCEWGGLGNHVTLADDCVRALRERARK